MRKFVQLFSTNKNHIQSTYHPFHQWTARILIEIMDRRRYHQILTVVRSDSRYFLQNNLPQFGRNLVEFVEIDLQ